MDEVTALDKTIDLRKLDWRQIEDLVSYAWGTASCRPKAFYERLDITADKPAVNDSQRPPQDTTPFTSHASTIDQVTCTDKTLKCRRHTDDGSKCDEEFIWSASEQLLHKLYDTPQFQNHAQNISNLLGTTPTNLATKLLEEHLQNVISAK